MGDDKNAKKGEYHEKRFADILNNYGIPFLFIEQRPEDEYRSTTLKESKIKRPDFMIYLNTIGHVFIDVKSRYTIEDIENTENNYVYLKDDQLDSLFSLQSYLMLPLWIAFVSTKKGDDDNFYFIPISVIKHYRDSLKKTLGADYKLLDYLFIRIPNSFLKKIGDINDLISVHNSFDFSIIEREAEKYRKINEKMKEIIEDMKKNSVQGTQEYCTVKGIEFVKVMEIEEYKKSNGI
jgi:hypothetical protein